MTNTNLTSSPPPPWYKQFWPWFLISFPAIAVIAGIATIILAIKSDDGLVKDDYYKAGLAINKTLEREQKAQALNLSAKVNWDILTQSISLELAGKTKDSPQQIRLILAHTTRADHDQTVPLFLAPDKKHYVGRTKKIKNGNWIVILEPEDSSWRINGRVTLPKQTEWHINSK